MTPLPPDWRGFFEALLAAGVEFVVIGALAVAAHAEPRYTEDLDVLVRPVRGNGVRLRKAMALFGFESVAPRPEEITDRDRVWMLGRKPFRIDILTSIAAVTFEEAWPRRKSILVDDIPISVIGRDDLLRNKWNTGRTKDRADAEWLEAHPPATD